MIAAAAGLLYFLSLSFIARPAISAVILLRGRALLGVGEASSSRERKVGASRCLVFKTPVI
jgi:hypothetical protein